MRVPLHQSAWLLFLGASPALASFEQFYFAGNAGNATGPVRCGDMIYDCPAPYMCSKDTLTQKFYCCDTGNSDGPCWTGSTKCEGTSDGKPSAQQTGCTNLGVDYCCHSEEKCTLNAKQFRICWSKQENPIRFLNSTSLNQTYSSLSSAKPKATSFSVNNQQLFAMTSTTPGVSSATPSMPSTASASASASASSTPSSLSQISPSSPSGLSGGAIGGIVGGVIGGLALFGLIAFLLWRRRKNTGKTDPHAAAGDPYQGYGYQPGHQPQAPIHEAHSPYLPQPGMAQMYQEAPPATKYAHTYQGPVEVPASNGPSEMDGGYYGPQHPK